MGGLVVGGILVRQLGQGLEYGGLGIRAIPRIGAAGGFGKD